MQINGPRSVTLTDEEASAKAEFELMLDGGWSLLHAAERIRETHTGLDPAFYRYIRGEQLMPNNNPEEDGPFHEIKGALLKYISDLVIDMADIHRFEGHTLEVTQVTPSELMVRAQPERRSGMPRYFRVKISESL